MKGIDMSQSHFDFMFPVSATATKQEEHKN